MLGNLRPDRLFGPILLNVVQLKLESEHSVPIVPKPGDAGPSARLNWLTSGGCPRPPVRSPRGLRSDPTLVYEPTPCLSVAQDRIAASRPSRVVGRRWDICTPRFRCRRSDGAVDGRAGGESSHPDPGVPAETALLCARRSTCRQLSRCAPARRGSKTVPRRAPRRRVYGRARPSMGSSRGRRGCGIKTEAKPWIALRGSEMFLRG